VRYRAFVRSLGLFVLVFVLSGCGGGGAGGGGGSDGPPAPGPAPIAQTPAGEPEGLSRFSTSHGADLWRQRHRRKWIGISLFDTNGGAS
jgi:hypothetical protein